MVAKKRDRKSKISLASVSSPSAMFDPSEGSDSWTFSAAAIAASCCLYRVFKASVRDEKLEKKRRVGFHQNYNTFEKPYESI
ncbi:MAG: hypothetical protein ACP5RH_21870 [Leptodesmis sp.]|uniref:hypothetical protein n=1 Tax=Leptodesmis sp. TaxID=3100501 RepID=UPI003D0B0E9F